MNKEQFIEISKWQAETFPKANSLTKLYHLKEEVKELIEAIEAGYSEELIRDEYGDCFMLLFGSAEARGNDYESVCDMTQTKFDVVKTRKWGEPDKNGVQHHIKESGIKHTNHIEIEDRQEGEVN